MRSREEVESIFENLGKPNQRISRKEFADAHVQSIVIGLLLDIRELLIALQPPSPGIVRADRIAKTIIDAAKEGS